VSVANRKLWRAAIASDLETALVPAYANALYAGQVATFNGASPVVVVSSAGSDRAENDSTQKHALFINLDVFVLYSDSVNGFDETDAEDKLDDIEAAIATWVKDNATRQPSVNAVGWTGLEYAGRTNADIGPASLGGQDYRYEQIGLRVTIEGAV
jgi:hypothetical protein